MPAAGRFFARIGIGTFLSLLGNITATFAVEVHTYCLMGNQYHLLVHTPRGNLSRAMRHLNGVYTQRYNRFHGTDDPLFRGRFKAILIDADTHLAAVSRYIYLDPVRATAVVRGEEYPWSSYPAYLGDALQPEWLRLQPTIGLFGERGARTRYRAFVEQGVDQEMHTFYSKGSLRPVMGGEDFHWSLARLRRAKQVDPEVP